MLKIIILCDQKWRDLPNLSVLRYGLEKNNFYPVITDTKNFHDFLNWFNPDAIILPHLNGEKYRTLVKNLKKRGIKIIILPTEGAGYPEFADINAGKYTDLNLCDLILPWSNSIKSRMYQIGNIKRNKVKVCGYHRLDFYSKNYKNLLINKSSFLKKYNLDPNKKIITWSTAFGYADLNLIKGSSLYKNWEYEIKDFGVNDCWQKIGVNFYDVPEILRQARLKSAQSFFYVASKLKNVQFIIKPHPMENRDFYYKKISQNALKNIRFANHEYIWDVLNVTDVELHRHCTTALEAWQWNLPTIEMSMDGVDFRKWIEREKGSENAYDKESLLEKIINFTKNNKVNKGIIKNRELHVKHQFEYNDGKNILRNIDCITNFLNNSYKKNIYHKKNKIHKLDFSFNYLKLFFKELYNKYLNIRKNDNRDKMITQLDIFSYRKRIKRNLSI